MRLLKRVGGILLDALTGPCETAEWRIESHYQTFQHSPSELPRALAHVPLQAVVVESRRIVYRTYYKRRWIPDRVRLVFQVQGRCPDAIRALLPPAFFETMVYPCLSNNWLRWTEYPHVAAINAFIDRFHYLDRSDLMA